ncbi:MAG: hypothetical protein HWN80_17945 [Candidatus Lokiarchaeota archaeon]|nr:hypothetical protein [Candidatus Lokiarchaeota archaeon]
MEINTQMKIAEEFLAIKNIFEKIGFEIVGTKTVNEDRIFAVKKKKKKN